ncbi:MAG: hypothetical protein J7K81_04955, partial [Methanophagales archaeon]|nr:hypothetical protein [Methanophagales archaeon]
MIGKRDNLREHRWDLKITTVLAGLLFLLATTAMAAALPLDSSSSGYAVTEANPSLLGEWIKKAPTPKAGGYGEAMVGTGKEIYIARCYNINDNPAFWRYDPENNSWDSMDTFGLESGAFRNGAALAWDSYDYIYTLLGARYPPEDVNRCLFYRYCISNNSWEQLADTPHAQGAGDAIAWSGYDGYIYAMMGSRSHKNGTQFARYNCSSNLWENLTMPENWKNKTDDGASLVWTGREYVYALQGEIGERKPHKPITNFSRYDLSTGRWVDMRPINESEGVGDGGSLLWIGNWLSEYRDYIFALGGGSGIKGEEPGNKSYCYSISRDMWKELEPIPCPIGWYVGNRLGFANGHIYYWQGAPSTWDCGGKAFYMFEFEISFPIFDTGPGTYPSIFGTHNGTITPNQTMNVSKLYTYPCPRTGGHTEYARIWNSTLDEITRWAGYKGDW